jgi:hypothetical protein
MIKLGVPWETVMKLGRWKSLSTLWKHYALLNSDLDVSGVLLDNFVLEKPMEDFNFLEDMEKEKTVFRFFGFCERN